jgi:hypothetical protein
MKISKHIRSKLLWARRFSRGDDIAIYSGRFKFFSWQPSTGIVKSWDYITGEETIFEF